MQQTFYLVIEQSALLTAAQRAALDRLMRELSGQLGEARIAVLRYGAAVRWLAEPQPAASFVWPGADCDATGGADLGVAMRELLLTLSRAARQVNPGPVACILVSGSRPDSLKAFFETMKELTLNPLFRNGRRIAVDLGGADPNVLMRFVGAAGAVLKADGDRGLRAAGLFAPE